MLLQRRNLFVTDHILLLRAASVVLICLAVKVSKAASKPAKVVKAPAKAPAKPKAVKKKPLKDIDENADESFMDVDHAVKDASEDDDGSAPSTSKAPIAPPRKNKSASEQYQQVCPCHNWLNSTESDAFYSSAQ